MVKVTYTGAGGHAHHNNPSGTTYVFNSGRPTEVTPEDAEHYAKEATRGGPWAVEGVGEQEPVVKPAEAEEPAKEEVKEEVPAARLTMKRGGKR